jgi:hypothetical protein
MEKSMEVKLRKPQTSRYYNADHVDHEMTDQVCVKFASVVSDKALIIAYQEAQQQEVTGYKWVRQSEFTKKKKEADRRRDTVYTGMLGIVRANLKNFNPAVRDHALHVFNLLNNYGDLTRSGYDARTAAIDSILACFDSSDYQAAVTVLGLSAWVQELSAQNNLFTRKSHPL